MEIDCSIIIPAYNAEDTIETCLKSIDIEKKTYSLEIVLINDGSSDNTEEVVERFQKSHSFARLKLVNKTNKGASAARNDGIDLAKGRFIFFMDADDTMNRTALDEMISIADKYYVDLVIGNYCTVTFDQCQKRISDHRFPVNCVLDNEYINNSIFPRMITGDTIGLAAVYNKLYRKQLIEKYGIRFDTNRIYGEDWVFNVRFFEQVHLLYAINNTVYYYNTVSIDLYEKYKARMTPMIRLYGISSSYLLCDYIYKKYCVDYEILYNKMLIKYYNSFLAFLSDVYYDEQVVSEILGDKGINQLLRALCRIRIRDFRLFDLSGRYWLCAMLLSKKRWRIALKLLSFY